MYADGTNVSSFTVLTLKLYNCILSSINRGRSSANANVEIPHSDANAIVEVPDSDDNDPNIDNESRRMRPKQSNEATDEDPNMDNELRRMRPNESNDFADEYSTDESESGSDIKSNRKRPNESNEVADEDPNKSKRMQPNESNEAVDEDPNKSERMRPNESNEAQTTLAETLQTLWEEHDIPNCVHRSIVAGRRITEGRVLEHIRVMALRLRQTSTCTLASSSQY